jgi:hypothetical protein
MYQLFGGDNHHPLGGIGDFRGSYKTIDEAIAKAKGEWVIDGFDGGEPLDVSKLEWWEIVTFDGKKYSVVVQGSN